MPDFGVSSKQHVTIKTRSIKRHVITYRHHPQIYEQSRSRFEQTSAKTRTRRLPFASKGADTTRQRQRGRGRTHVVVSSQTTRCMDCCIHFPVRTHRIRTLKAAVERPLPSSYRSQSVERKRHSLHRFVALPGSRATSAEDITKLVSFAKSTLKRQRLSTDSYLICMMSSTISQLTV